MLKQAHFNLYTENEFFKFLKAKMFTYFISLQCKALIYVSFDSRSLKKCLMVVLSVALLQIDYSINSIRDKLNVPI